ncbi:hypothetical protein AB1Y20_017388 [Prymnesium parvum]|uniref:EF-hand domain-containing protein n=1 Tax=Prymnesium parvum TaxID=97485 RepID=A0AB34JNX1_PRYPA
MKRSVAARTALEKPAARSLIAALEENVVPLTDLFRTWDEQGSGLVTKREFIQGLSLLGGKFGGREKIYRDAAHALFESFDADGAGAISYVQLHAILSHGKASPRPAALVSRPSGSEIAREPLPKGPAVHAALRRALAGRSGEVVELLRNWDDEGSGTVTRRDFWRALPLLGLQVLKEDFEQVFDAYRPKGSDDAARTPLAYVERRLRKDAAKPPAPRRADRPAAAPPPPAAPPAAEAPPRRAEFGEEPPPPDEPPPQYPELEAASAAAAEAAAAAAAALDAGRAQLAELQARVDAFPSGGKGKHAPPAELLAEKEAAAARLHEELEPAAAAAADAARAASGAVRQRQLNHTRRVLAARMDEEKARRAEVHAEVMREVAQQLRAQPHAPPAADAPQRARRTYPTVGHGLPGPLGGAWVRPSETGGLFGAPAARRLPRLRQPSDPLAPLRQLMGARLPALLEAVAARGVEGEGKVSRRVLAEALDALSLPPNDDAVLRQAFEGMDADGKGEIDLAELRRAVVPDSPRRKLPKIAAAHAAEGSGASQREAGREAERAMARLKEVMSGNLKGVVDVLKEWDKEANGTISIDEMRRALAALSMPIDEAALSRLFRQADADGAGAVKVKDLNTILRKQRANREASGQRVESVSAAQTSYGLGGATNPQNRSNLMYATRQLERGATPQGMATASKLSLPAIDGSRTKPVSAMAATRQHWTGNSREPTRPTRLFDTAGGVVAPPLA